MCTSFIEIASLAVHDQKIDDLLLKEDLLSFKQMTTFTSARTKAMSVPQFVSHTMHVIYVYSRITLVTINTKSGIDSWLHLQVLCS